MKEFNINHYVHIRLTEKGRQILRDKHEELRAYFPNEEYQERPEDKDGWSKWQLHDVMRTFGGCMYAHSDVPFETTIKLEC